MPVFCLCFSARRMLLQSAVLRWHVVRACVRPSVCNVRGSGPHTHICCQSWKLIARTITPTPTLFVAQRPSTYFQGNMGKVWGDYRWVTGESGVQEHKSGNTSDTRKDRGKVIAYIGTHQRFFERFHPRSPTTFSSWRLCFETATTPINHYWWVKIRTSNFVRTVTVSIRTKVH